MDSEVTARMGLAGERWRRLRAASHGLRGDERTDRRRHRDGRLAVSVAARFPLREAPVTHALLESRGSAGNVLLIPDDCATPPPAGVAAVARF